MRMFNVKGAVALIIAGFLALAPVTAASAAPGPQPVPSATLVSTDSGTGFHLDMFWESADVWNNTAPDYYRFDLLENGQFLVYSLTTDTTASFDIPYGSGDEYQFYVTAYYGGNQTAPRYSNNIRSYDPTLIDAATNVVISDESYDFVGNTEWSFNVDWDAASVPGGGDIAYIVYVYDDYSNELVQMLNASDTTAVISGLPGDHYYSAEVLAENAHGTTALSSRSNAPFFALYTAPSTPNDVSVVRSKTGNTATVNWVAPDNDGGTPVTGYTLVVTDITDADVEVYSGSFDASTTSYALSGLSIDHKYRYTVSAVNAKGTSGSYSTEANFRVVPPSAPTNAVVTIVDSTHVKVAWDASAYNGGSAVNYNVQVVGSDFGFFWEQTSNNSIIIEVGAHPTVTYSATVSASNSDFESDPIDATSATQPAGLPSGIDLHVYSYEFYAPSVYTSWYVANQNGATITGYTLILKDGNGATLQQAEVAEGGVLSHEFFEVGNGSNYSVTLVTHSNLGDVTTNGAVTTPPHEPSIPSYNAIHDPSVEKLDVGVDESTKSLTIDLSSLGLVEGDYVYGVAFSDPTRLGWVRVGALGVTSFSIASANLPAGTHTLLVLGSQGNIVMANTLQLAAGTPAAVINDAVELAKTGSNPERIAVFAMLLLLGGIAAVRASRRRDADSLI